MIQLLRIAGFLPFVVMVFLNAFVDLGHKILIQNTLFKIYAGNTQILLTALVNALILLPFILLFTPSGYLADRFSKPRVMQISAWLAVGLTLGITLFYYLGWFWPAFLMTFLLAAQSAIYSPAKYGYIKELVGQEALARANGLVQATVTSAILGGIFVFSVLFERNLAGQTYATPGEVMQLIAPLGGLLVGFSILELMLAYRLPQRWPGNSALRFDWTRYRQGRYLVENLAEARGNRVVWLSIVGLSLFWGISQVLVAAFPAFAKAALGETDTVVIQGAMAASGIGIVLGSVIAGRISRTHIETGLIPVGALGIAFCLFLLPELSRIWAQGLNFFLLGVLGGFFIVPLNALIQFNTEEHSLGRILAANNFVQNLVMLSFLGLTVVAAFLESGSVRIIQTLGLIALLGAAYTLYQLPQSLVRFLVARAVALRYRLQVIGLKHLPPEGGVLLLGNHISWIDWAMVQLASPRPVRFVLLRSIYERWYLRWFFDFFGVIPISGTQSKGALQAVSERLNAGEVVCLFPEGAISRNGQLGEFKRGFERAARTVRSGIILPFYLRGLWGSEFSFASDKIKQNRGAGRMREVVVAFGKPLPLQSNAEQVKQAVFELSISAWQTYAASLPTVPEAWLRAASRNLRAWAIADADGTRWTNRRLIAAVLLFSRRIRRLAPESRVGVLLPPTSAGAIANLAVLLCGKTVVNINYTAPPEAVRAGLARAGVKTVISAQRFLKKLSGRGIDGTSLIGDAELHSMEALKATMGKGEGLLMLALAGHLPVRWVLALFGHRAQPEDTAAILFSSGSEGTPKGIELSHRNLLANVRQTADVLNMDVQDVVLSNLPLFHAFGLTVTTFMPLLEGLPLVCHPDPTDALGNAKAIARYGVTLLCGTSTFLRLYSRNRRIHPLMLASLRFVVAGAERLDPAVREAFALQFGKTIYEGYGATETSPVASCNLPDCLNTDDWTVQIGNKPGTVGMPLPGTSFRIVDPETLEPLPTGEAGLILIGGVQVMKGYLEEPEKTAAAIIEIDGQRWYKTGDKGQLDRDGFLKILDRYSRFAKIGGEMISLTQVEDQVRRILQEPERELVAVNLPDERKGERIVLLVAGELDGEGLRQALIRAGCNPLTIPAAVYSVEAVPKLGSGKTDFANAKRLAARL